MNRIPYPSLALAILALAMQARAAQGQAVFNGDPIDPANGAAYCILPGRPLVYPGPDARFGTADDIVDTSLVGDIDVVLRTGGRFTAGGAIPETAAGAAAAPAIVAGGLHGMAGSLVPFQLILVDGGPLGGNPLPGPELDLRRALIVAYADLDGDGFIGPTANADPAEVQIQRQEALTFAGRAMVEMHDGVGSGEIGVSIGAPASSGGLGIVVAAGAATGATPNLYADGPWIATSLPYMIPLTQSQIVGGEATGPVDPVGLVDLELSLSALYLPPPTHPTLGGIFAIPLDGSDASIDLLHSHSGKPVGAGFGVPIDRSTFVAKWGRVLRVAVDQSGRQDLVEDAPALALPADGPGNGATVLLFPVDLLGNPTDPPSGGLPITLEVSGGLRISSPDTDGDPLHESILFSSASYVPVTVDDSALAVNGGEEHLTALAGGVPTGMVSFAISGGAPVTPAAPTPTSTAAPTSVSTPTSTSAPISTATSSAPTSTATPAPPPLSVQSAVLTLGHARKSGRDHLHLRTTFSAGAAVDPGTQAVVLSLRGSAGTIYERAVAPGAFRVGKRKLVLKDRHTRVVFARSMRQPTRVTLDLSTHALDLSGVPVDVADVEATVTIGSSTFQAMLSCSPNRAGRVTRCAR